MPGSAVLRGARGQQGRAHRLPRAGEVEADTLVSGPLTDHEPSEHLCAAQMGWPRQTSPKGAGSPRRKGGPRAGCRVWGGLSTSPSHASPLTPSQHPPPGPLGWDGGTPSGLTEGSRFTEPRGTAFLARCGEGVGLGISDAQRWAGAWGGGRVWVWGQHLEGGVCVWGHCLEDGVTGSAQRGSRAMVWVWGLRVAPQPLLHPHSCPGLHSWRRGQAEAGEGRRLPPCPPPPSRGETLAQPLLTTGHVCPCTGRLRPAAARGVPGLDGAPRAGAGRGTPEGAMAGAFRLPEPASLSPCLSFPVAGRVGHLSRWHNGSLSFPG